MDPVPRCGWRGAGFRPAVVAENEYRERYGIGGQNASWGRYPTMGWRPQPWYGRRDAMDLLRARDPAAVRGLLPWEDATKGKRGPREAMDWVGEVLGW